MRRVAGAVLVVWALCLMGVTYSRGWTWRSDEALFRSAVALNPSHPRPWINWGAALAREGQVNAAIVAYEIGRSKALDLGMPAEAQVAAWNRQTVLGLSTGVPALDGHTIALGTNCMMMLGFGATGVRGTPTLNGKFADGTDNPAASLYPPRRDDFSLVPGFSGC